MTILHSCSASLPRALGARNWRMFSSIAARANSAAKTNRDYKPLFDKILIANRGEIACRIMRTAKELGIKTVAVYSSADSHSMHTHMADESYMIGSAAASDSYLRSDKLIEVVKKSGAQAIHPGYGFLSENAEFADRLIKEGVTFIGPPGSAMRSMGSKSESKKIMQAAGVPVVPGYHGENQDPEFLKQKANEIGYPVLIKAVLGGGGKGMRVVEREEDFESMLESSRREALKSFNDDKVLIEKYLTTPRHVEVQVFADKHGNAVHLFERDCSVQRRHQKIIEEAPAPSLLPEVRRQLGEKAVAAARAVNYVGAGTVEFIMDNETQQFYFMEMNTRLQVEHPVTEMVTNTDLVRWQLEVAAGNPLPCTQEEIKCNGHAFEARIYAENPENNFLPDTGRLIHLSTPTPSPTVRVETGVSAGDTISVYYDPMIAKLIVHGKDRKAALRVLRKALDEYHVVGLHTNIDFLKRLAKSPDFINGNIETGFIAKHTSDLFPTPPAPSPEVIAQASLARIIKSHHRNNASHRSGAVSSPWDAVDSFCVNLAGMESTTVSFGDSAVYTVEFLPDSNRLCTIKVKDDQGNVLGQFDNAQPQWLPQSSNNNENGLLSVLLGERLCKSRIVFNDHNDTITVFDQGNTVQFKVPQPQYLIDSAGEVGAGSVTAPMSCKIVQVLVEPGQEVAPDTPLVVLEAMKMEHVIKAPKAGKIADVYYKVGDLVDEGKNLVAFEESETESKEQ